MPLQVVPLDIDQALKAAQIEALHAIPYIDCMAAALTSLRGGTLVTSDRHFESSENISRFFGFPAEIRRSPQ